MQKFITMIFFKQKIMYISIIARNFCYLNASYHYNIYKLDYKVKFLQHLKRHNNKFKTMFLTQQKDKDFFGNNQSNTYLGGS